MQFEPRKRIKVAINGEDSNPYPYSINFYKVPPSCKITLQEIEDVAMERLKLLQVVDNMLNVDINKRTKQFYEVTLSQLNAIKSSNNEKNFFSMGRSSEQSTKVFEARKRDHISHFLLRIYYCKSQELREWYVKRETELFRLRLMESSFTNSTMLQDFLVHSGYNYEIVSTNERADLHELINWTENNKTNLSSIAFKLNFEDALDLVRNRKVYLSNGSAYIAANEMLSVFCNEFRSNLSRELTKMAAYLESVDEQRLVMRLESLHQSYISTNIKKSVNDENQYRNEILPEQIDELSKEAFPPCMRSIHETLRRDHHLKHYGRLHYGLFLKSGGLSLDNAINFFRSEMSITNPEKFQKEYSYTIRYIYGKEGKRVQLSPYSCQKIINGSAPGPTDSHGCPFKHFDTKNLKAMLIRYGVNDESSLNEIIRIAQEDKNISGACSKYFTVKVGSAPQSSNSEIYHPNQFFTYARKELYAPQMPPPTTGAEFPGDGEVDISMAADTTINSAPNDSIMDDSVDYSDYDELIQAS